MRENIIVFLGPTMSQHEASQFLKAFYLPPAKQGDIASVVSHYRPSIIGLIDGEFYQALSVWHKEILFALDSNIKVFGSSSMGALRGAELASCGMIGIGDIYQQYKSGTLNDDDEVALIYGDESSDYKNLSLPLVNIRATLNELLNKKIITEEEYSKLIFSTKSLYFPDRNIDIILETAFPKRQREYISNIKSEFIMNYVDLKKLDATLLLNTIASEAKTRSPINIQYPNNLGSFYNHERAVIKNGNAISLGKLSNFLAINMENFQEINFHALNKHIVTVFSDFLGLKIEEHEVEREIHIFKLKYDLLKPEKFEQWLHSNDLIDSEFKEIMRDIACCKKMHKYVIYSKKITEKNTKIIMDELKSQNTYEYWKSKALCYESKFQEAYPYFDYELKETSIEELFKHYLHNSNQEIWGNYQAWLDEAGFQDQFELIYELTRFNSLNDLSKKARSEVYNIWLHKNLNTFFNKIVINLQNTNEIEIEDDYVTEVVKKCLRSSALSNKMVLVWLLNGDNKKCIDQIIRNIFSATTKFNIYEKSVSHRIQITLNMFDFFNFSLLSEKSRLCLKLDLTLRDLDRLKNNISKLSKATAAGVPIEIILVINNETHSTINKLGSYLKTLSGYSISLDISNEFNDESNITYLLQIIQKMIDCWFDDRNSINIMEFETVLSSIKKRLTDSNHNIFPNHFANPLVFINAADINLKYTQLTDNKMNSNELSLSSLNDIDSLDDLMGQINGIVNNHKQNENHIQNYLHAKIINNNYFNDEWKKFEYNISNEIRHTLLIEKIITDHIINHLVNRSNSV